MPAPKALAALPKPILFGLYGAVGGLLGALAFGELLYSLLSPPNVEAAPPAPQVAVAASPEVEVFVEGRNAFPVQVARGDFDGPVTIRVEGLPAGVAAEPLAIPAGKSEGEIVLVASGSAQAVDSHQARVVAGGGPEGRKATAEAPISVKVTDPPKPLADVAFVLDVTNSMQWAIDDLKNGIGKFAESLAKARIDFRLALVTFQDVTNPGEKVEVVQFKGGPFTADAGVFRDEVSRLKASGGGDIPESSLEGVAEACKLPFRKDATKVLLLITDAPPKVVRFGDPESAVRAAADRVRDANIDAVHTVVHRLDERTYQPLAKAGTDKSGGKYFNLSDVVRGEEGFDAVLSSFGSAVTAAAIAKNPAGAPRVAARSREEPKVKSLQSSEKTAAGSEGRVVLRSGVWTGAVAALVCLALLAGQHHYLRGTLPPAGGAVAGLLGGLVVGLVGGGAAQGLFFLAPDSAALAHSFRVLGWALSGGLAGVGLSLFIPNMKWAHGLIGGALGGAAGAAGFILASSATGELVGRLVGGLALGLGIGLMVAVAETAFRRAWLEVRYGGREKITVTLGPEPVKVGSDAKACTVWARGAPPVAMRFFVRDGQVVCDDLAAGRELVVGDGFEKEVGTLVVTVRTGGSGEGGSGRARSQPRRERAARKPEVEPLSLDDVDDLNLPMPPSVPAETPAPARQATPPARPAPAPPKPPVPGGSKPPAPAAKPPVPRPVIPPVAPAIKSTATRPDGCPGCGRAVPGKPGARYCMICDQTF